VNHRCRRVKHITRSIHYGLLIRRRETCFYSSLQLEGHVLCVLRWLLLLAVASMCVHRIIRSMPEYDRFPFQDIAVVTRTFNFSEHMQEWNCMLISGLIIFLDTSEEWRTTKCLLPLL
jgi:hypothetical protein